MVYVVQAAPDKNLLPAERYGMLQVLLPPGQLQLDSGWAVNQLRHGLKNFDDRDYLLCVGDPAAIGLACAVAAAQNGGRVKLLKWDRQERRYYPVTADITEVKNEAHR